MSNPILRLSIFAALYCVALVSEVSPVSAQIKEGEKLDAVVAVVGKHPIFKSSVDAQVQYFIYRRGGVGFSGDSLMQLRKQILEAQVDQKILLARAEQDSVVVTEPEVDDRIEQQIKLYQRQLGSEAAVEKQFGKSIAELRAAPELRDRAREALMVERLRYEHFPAPPPVSRRDVQKFYEFYRDSLPRVGESLELASIVKLVKPADNQKSISKTFAESLRDSLREGADFATLARKYSQHSTAAAGGDLGAFFPRGTFLPEFEAAAFALKPGEVSDVVETSQGFHIIKLLERRGEEIRIAQILIKPTATANDEKAVRNELMQLRERALAGEDFAALAREYSDDEETKVLGGALGRIPVSELSSEQRSVLDSLPLGGISMPIHVQYPTTVGYQIVKLVDKIAPHDVSVDADYKQLEAAAAQWKQSNEFEQFIKDSRSSVYVQIRDLASFY